MTRKKKMKTNKLLYLIGSCGLLFLLIIVILFLINNHYNNVPTIAGKLIF